MADVLGAAQPRGLTPVVARLVGFPPPMAAPLARIAALVALVAALALSACGDDDDDGGGGDPGSPPSAEKTETEPTISEQREALKDTSTKPEIPKPSGSPPRKLEKEDIVRGKGPAANLRVQELFPKCLSVGVWSLRPMPLITCLAFITKASNVNLAAKTMANVPRKHVGIYVGGFIYHYSNSQQKVVKQTPSQFALHYPSPHNAMFYGSMPSVP